MRTVWPTHKRKASYRAALKASQKKRNRRSRHRYGKNQPPKETSHALID